MDKSNIYIITGLSGAGKSTTLAVFEDAGFYCVDNLPVALLPKILKTPVENRKNIKGFAFVMDLREKDFVTKAPVIFNTLKNRGILLKIIFLEAAFDVLIKRFSQTRRQHPLIYRSNLYKSIHEEIKQLSPFKLISDKIIDTTKSNVHQLKTIIKNSIFKKDISTKLMYIYILSVGFKYGIPPDADLIIDVRFLANPYFVPELKDLNGENRSVSDYVLNDKNATVFLQKYFNLIDFLIPLYNKEGKSYLTIAIGCTGGKHRSVAISTKVLNHIVQLDYLVSVTHRDMKKQ